MAAGSSWLTELLASHPDITSLGEVFNDIKDREDYEKICTFLSAPPELVPQRLRGEVPLPRGIQKVRGFK